MVRIHAGEPVISFDLFRSTLPLKRLGLLARNRQQVEAARQMLGTASQSRATDSNSIILEKIKRVFGLENHGPFSKST